MNRTIVLALTTLGLALLIADLSPRPTSADPPTRPAPATTASPRPSPSPLATRELLVWGHGGIDGPVADAARRHGGVRELAVVAGDRVDVVRTVTADGVIDELPPGWAWPLDAQAVDPTSFAPFVSAATRSALRGLGSGQALLPATSARLRGLGPGARLLLADGTEVTVAGVVDDRDAGWSELLLPADDPAGVRQSRYLLVHVDEPDVSSLVDALVSASDEPLRIVDAAGTTYRRHGEGVLPPVVAKDVFGEFAFREVPGREVRVSGSWFEANIDRATVPILGRVTCHAEVLPHLRAALQHLVDAGLAHLVDPDGYAGCWVGRVIGASRTLSRHSWGIALDLNVVGGDPFDVDIDPRVVATMRDHGFAWGGRYLRPDNAHFEYVGTPPAVGTRLGGDDAGPPDP